MRQPGQINRTDAHPLRPHHHGHGDLACKPWPWGEREEIIRQTDEKETERTGEGGPDQLVAIRCQQTKAT